MAHACAQTESPPATLSSQWASLESKLKEFTETSEAGEVVMGTEKQDRIVESAEIKKNFKAKRAAHYNEFQRIKELKAQGLLDDDK